MEFVFNVFLIVKYIMCSHVYKTHTFIHIQYIHIYVHFKVQVKREISCVPLVIAFAFPTPEVTYTITFVVFIILYLLNSFTVYMHS